MSKKVEYSENNIKPLTLPEAIRKRPGMYIGQVNVRGFMEMLKGIISSAIVRTNASFLSVELKDFLEAKISFTNSNKAIQNNWEEYKNNPTNPFLLDLYALNALSEKFKICFWKNTGEKIKEQKFEKGVLVEGEAIEHINCSFIEVEFLLDKIIWGTDFKWNKIYIAHHLREFAYLNKRTKFEIKYKEGEEDCRVVYNFKNGLKDRIDIELLNGFGGSYFDTTIDAKIGDFRMEAAFAFRDYSVDVPYLKSYANDYFTVENGTHVDGLLKGLTYGVMKYFQKNELTEAYKISEKGIRENLVAAINIQLDAPLFSGCVKNKLANPEIIEPIANYIAEVLFKKIEEDEVGTKRLIRKFEV